AQPVKFSELLRGTGASRSGGDPWISGLDYDSRRIQPGWVFVALRGSSTDGNRFINSAVKNGAVAIVTDSPADRQPDGVAWALVSHGRQALARLSASYYGEPF